MPRKHQHLTSFPPIYSALFIQANKKPLRIPMPSYKAAQYYIADLNRFRVALRNSMHSLSLIANTIILSPKGDEKAGEVYMRSQMEEYRAMEALIDPKIMQEAMTVQEELIEQERKEIYDATKDVEQHQSRSIEALEQITANVAKDLGFDANRGLPNIPDDMPGPHWLDKDLSDKSDK